jgi:hypothetical protein
MEAMVLNDERFNAFWCRRELEAGGSSGFNVVRYHDEPRYGAILEKDAIAAFRTGAASTGPGGDVLVMNRPVDVGVSPVRVFTTARGVRIIYRR